MTTTYVTCQMWSVTALYGRQIMFANYNDALQCAWQWEDECLDGIEIELVDIIGSDDFPF